MEKRALKDAFSQTRKQATDLSAPGLHTHIKTNTMCAQSKTTDDPGNTEMDYDSRTGGHKGPQYELLGGGDVSHHPS